MIVDLGIRLSSAIFGDYEAMTPLSRAMFSRARAVLPGGVSGNLRYFAPYPLYMTGGSGAYTNDLDGNRYLDCFLCNGPLLLGHRPAAIVEAMAAAEDIGSLVLNPAILVDCAEAIVDVIPSAQAVRFLNSGTEAVAAAVRMARAYTGRSRILKFHGHYHGQDDQLLVAAGPGRTPFGAGIPPSRYSDTLTLPIGDFAAVEAIIANDPDLAAVIIDPAMHAGGLWGVAPETLHGLRALTKRHGVLLILDEVITGFRLAPGGAQAIHSVSPDLSTFAKALGAGEKIAAIVGRRDVMAVVDPLAMNMPRAFQSGTGNDCTRALAAAAAAIGCYRTLGAAGEYGSLDALGKRLAGGLVGAFSSAGIPLHVNQKGSMLQLFLAPQPASFEAYATVDQRLLDLFYLAMIARGIILSLPTSNHIYLSFSHTENDIDRAVAAAIEVLAAYPFADAWQQQQELSSS